MSPIWCTVVAGLILSVMPSIQGQSDVTKEEAKAIVKQTRGLTSRAREGSKLSELSKELDSLEKNSAVLLAKFPDTVSECESQLVIKLAAAAVGSHEVLSLLVANDIFKVLDGRVALAWALLDQSAQQLQDELSVSLDIAPHLKAILFSANVTSEIIDTAAALLKQVAEQNDKSDRKGDGTRFDTGSGAISSPAKRQWTTGIGVNKGPNGWEANGKIQYEKGGFTGSFTPTWSQGGGWGGGISATWKFK